MIAKVCDRESRRDTWFENRLVKQAGTQNPGPYPYIFFPDLQSTPIKVPYTKIWLKTNERFSDDQKTLRFDQFLFSKWWQKIKVNKGTNC